jgi:hypothetical protein
MTLLLRFDRLVIDQPSCPGVPMPPNAQFDVFLCYSPHDATVVDALAKRLQADGLQVWFGQWQMQIGDAIFHKLEQGLANSRCMILCMSAQAFESDWVQVLNQTLRCDDPLNRARRLIPLRLDDAALPGTLAQFLYLDWRTPNEEGYQRLLQACRIAGIKPTSAATNPSASQAPQTQIDIDRIVPYAPEHLLGREGEMAMLIDAWQQVLNDVSPAVSPASSPAVNPTVSPTATRPHLLSLVAMGGAGKTSLLAHWALQLARQGWPGCDAVLAWSFYSQGTDRQAAASSDLFISEALRFFGEGELAASAQNAVDKAKKLAQVIGARRVLLLLDGVEPLQYAPTSAMRGELKDPALAQLLRSLALQNRGLCVLTTRHAIPDLKAFWQTSAPQHSLARLSTPAGVALLQTLGVHGAPDDMTALVQALQGHALSLHLFGSYLHDAHAGDIRRRDRVHLGEADAQEQGGHAFRVMAAYEAWLAGAGIAGRRALSLLRLMGLFDRPASAACLGALLQAPLLPGLTDDLPGLDDPAFTLCTTRLQDAGLLTVNRDSAGGLLSLDAHPLLREYFAQTLATSHPATWQAAHAHLFAHLCEVTKDKPQPKLEDLQPLYQAVAHGCLAGLWQQACDEVYRDRISRRAEDYVVSKLGAFGTDLGALACFFVQPWQRVAPALSAPAQSWVLGQAATRLRAVGRLREALEPMRAALAQCVAQQNWQQAAISAGNLSELQLTLGELAGALLAAEQAVAYADRYAEGGGAAFLPMSTRTTHADALHQAGQPAAALFAKAEAMQAARQPAYPLLYSLSGFWYCDWLLAPVELAAWQCAVALAGAAPPEAAGRSASQIDAGAQTCHAVSQRAATALEIVLNGSRNLLDIALNHLTLACAALFTQQSAACQTALAQALDGLRRAGDVEFLARGLLTRAWHLAQSHDHISAKADLDEAMDIAARGPMPLFMADIHLWRAHFFHRCTPYPWPGSASADVQEARRLIELHGYLRRMPFLQITEQALGLQP